MDKVEYLNILNGIGDEYVIKVINILRANNKVATGELVKSVEYITGQNKSGDFFIQLIMADYWYYIENGRRSGSFMPFDKLKEWMSVKGIPESALWPINMKIKRDGIKGIFFLQQAIEEINKSVQNELVNNFGTIFEKDIYNKLKITLAQR